MGGTEVTPGFKLLILDIDVKSGKDGYQSLKQLEDKFGTLPSTTTVETPSGGEHQYFLVPKEISLTGISKFFDHLGFPGLDLIGDGLFAVAPPSQIDGNPYELISSGYISEAPPWLELLLKARSRTTPAESKGRQEKPLPVDKKSRKIYSPAPSDTDCSLQNVCRRFPVTEPGMRHYMMSRAVCSLVGHGLDEESVLTTMTKWLEHFEGIYSSTLDEALISLQATYKSTVKGFADGRLQYSGQDHSQIRIDWELTPTQQQFLVGLKDGFSEQQTPLLYPSIIEGYKHHSLTEQEAAFLEVLLVMISHKKSQKEKIFITDRQLMELMIHRQGFGWSDMNNRTPIKRLRRKFVSVEGKRATKQEFLVRKEKGRIKKGKRIPSEYELAGILKELEEKLW